MKKELQLPSTNCPVEQEKMEVVPWYYLPELVEDVLCRLPFKFRFRFTAVCKMWNEVITATRNKPTNRKLFLVGGCSSVETQISFFLDTDVSFEKFVSFNCPEGDRSFRMTGFGNGLILFSDHSHDILWNPLTNKHLHLPMLTEGSQRDVTCAYGIVADQSNNDCRIFLLDMNFAIHMLRLSTGRWEVLQRDRPFAKMYIGQVDLKGKSYWIGLDVQRKTVLISFDMHTESFSSVRLPVPELSQNKVFIFGKRYWQQVLFSFEESLIFIHGKDYDGDVDDNEKYEMTCEIWKMVDSDEGQKWDLCWAVSFKKRMIPLGFMENGELLWAERKSNKVNSGENGELAESESLKLISTNLKNCSGTYVSEYWGEDIVSYPNYVENLPPLQTTRNRRNRRPPSYLADYECEGGHEVFTPLYFL